MVRVFMASRSTRFLEHLLDGDPASGCRMSWQCSAGARFIQSHFFNRENLERWHRASFIAASVLFYTGIADFEGSYEELEIKAVSQS